MIFIIHPKGGRLCQKHVWVNVGPALAKESEWDVRREKGKGGK
jgi:hypothetical protein